MSETLTLWHAEPPSRKRRKLEFLRVKDARRITESEDAHSQMPTDSELSLDARQRTAPASSWSAHDNTSTDREDLMQVDSGADTGFSTHVSRSSMSISEATTQIPNDPPRNNSNVAACPCGFFHGPSQGDHHDIHAVGLSNKPLLRGPD